MTSDRTLVLGDLSGLQGFLFDVAPEGGGQARRLRARSLSISLLVECAARRILEAAGWTRRELVFSSAGKFLLEGPPLSRVGAGNVSAEAGNIARWLLAETGGSLRLGLAICEWPSGEPPAIVFGRAQGMLQREKRKPWAGIAAASGQWQVEGLVLPPLAPPCELCHRRPARQTYDDDGVIRNVCRRCHGDWQLGRELPNALILELYASPGSAALDLLGFGVRASAERRPSPGIVQCFPLDPQFPPDDSKIVPRRLARHVPQDPDGHPIEFRELATRSEGMPLLGVLKMDADDLGLAFGRILDGASSLLPVMHMSKRLDDFFAHRVDTMMNTAPWDSLYVVFSGGDDLLLVGPWDVAFAFAAEVQREFAREFSKDGLTISAGLAVIKPTFPIRNAVEQADELLERAKAECSPGARAAKDQFASFGQVWKWGDHHAVTRSAKQIIGWVRDDKVMPRGWLHTLLELAEARLKPVVAPVTARLAYHIGRNLPPRQAEGPRGAMRRWAENLVADFDAASRPETRFLPAILRYSLTATRSPTKDES